MEPCIPTINISDDTITSELTDGPSISVPLAWNWRLTNATSAQRKNFTIIGNDQGIHWPDIAEDISACITFEDISARPATHPA